MIINIIFWVFFIGDIVSITLFVFFLFDGLFEDIIWSNDERINCIKEMWLKVKNEKKEFYMLMIICSFSWFFLLAIPIFRLLEEREDNRKWNSDFHHLSDNNR
jgi:hypothetical protein